MATTKDQTADPKASDADLDKPANIPPAKGVDASGAPQQIVPDVDMSHPAVDDNPRAGTSVRQNKIDFNDPTIPGHEAVAKALSEQGVPTKTADEAAEAAETAKRGK